MSARGAVALALVVLAGCSGNPPGASGESPTNTPPPRVPTDAPVSPPVAAAKVDGLELSATVALQGGALVVHYEVKNTAARDVYLLNRLFHDGAISPDVAQVELDRATKVVEVSKRLADIPAGPGPTSPVAPYVTPVRAGQSFAEDIHLAMPVQIWSDYGPNGGGRHEVEYEGVRFTLGYYWRGEGVTETTQRALGQEVILPGPLKAGRLELGRLQSAVMPLRVRVSEP